MLSDRCLSLCLVTLVYCGQMVGWIKMPLGTEVDGAVPPRKGAQQPHPTFRPMSIVAKGSPNLATAELFVYFSLGRSGMERVNERSQ